MRDKDVGSVSGGQAADVLWKLLPPRLMPLMTCEPEWRLGWAGGLHRLTVNVLSRVSLIGDDHFYNHTWYTVQKYNSEVK